MDVSFYFDLIIALFFINSVTGAFTGFYHVLSIYFFNNLLRFSQFVGVFNKLNLFFGAMCMLFMHLTRLSFEGKVCSGDFLSSEDFSLGSDDYLI